MRTNLQLFSSGGLRWTIDSLSHMQDAMEQPQIESVALARLKLALAEINLARAMGERPEPHLLAVRIYQLAKAAGDLLPNPLFAGYLPRTWMACVEAALDRAGADHGLRLRLIAALQDADTVPAERAWGRLGEIVEGQL